MEIRRLTEQDYGAFLEFHAKAYPFHINVKERFKFQFLENPLLQDKSKTDIFFARDKENKIIGQYGVNRVEYSFGDTTSLGFCGCDLFVEEQARKYGVGGFLSMKAILSCKPHFSIGVSKEAEPILRSLQMKKIGQVYRYLWFNKWSKFPKLIVQTLWSKKRGSCRLSPEKKTIPNNHPAFPLIISLGKDSFSLISSPHDLTSPHLYSSKRISVQKYLSFVRNSAFFHWRFFTKPGYYVYNADSSSGYFVITSFNWKNLNLLAIVDLQTENLNPKTITSMIAATKKIAEMNDYDGVITLSSNVALDGALKKSFFVSVGPHFDIYANVNIPFSEEQIQQRETTYITMADSDLEFSFWPKA